MMTRRPGRRSAAAVHRPDRHGPLDDRRAGQLERRDDRSSSIAGYGPLAPGQRRDVGPSRRVPTAAGPGDDLVRPGHGPDLRVLLAPETRSATGAPGWRRARFASRTSARSRPPPAAFWTRSEVSDATNAVRSTSTRAGSTARMTFSGRGSPSSCHAARSAARSTLPRRRPRRHGRHQGEPRRRAGPGRAHRQRDASATAGRPRSSWHGSSKSCVTLQTA